MWADVEQQALVTTLRTLGPDHDTLCAGWHTRHLAAHLYLRARKPWQALGRSADDRVAELAEECRDPGRYRAVIDAFNGPMPWPWKLSRMRPMNEAGNLVEYVVHHEDARRAGPEPAEPRSLPAELLAAIWSKFAPTSPGFYLPAPVGVLLVVPGGPTKRARPGADPVRVVGAPVEQALYAMGRRDQARVELRGSTARVEAFRRWADGR